MAAKPVNILLSTFPGLSLPGTLSLSLPSTSTVSDLTEKIETYLPDSLKRTAVGLVLTTTNNKQLLPTSSEPLTSFLPTQYDSADGQCNFLPLRLSAPLRGGKGGFGSQLRAIGGRMSSKRRRNQQEDNGSNRNLDGRRLRTVNEAKALAEYLAVKPEMERKEREERRKRWEAVIEMAERRTEELKNGGKARIDGQWMEAREEMTEKAREAVLAAMKDGMWKDNLHEGLVGGSSSSASEGNSSQGETSGTESEEDNNTDAKVTHPSGPVAKPSAPRRYVGFDDDDEFMSEDEEEAGDQ